MTNFDPERKYRTNYQPQNKPTDITSGTVHKDVNNNTISEQIVINNNTICVSKYVYSSFKVEKTGL